MADERNRYVAALVAIRDPGHNAWTLEECDAVDELVEMLAAIPHPERIPALLEACKRYKESDDMVAAGMCAAYAALFTD